MFDRKKGFQASSLKGMKSDQGMTGFPPHIQWTKRRRIFLVSSLQLEGEVIRSFYIRSFYILIYLLSLVINLNLQDLFSVKLESKKIPYNITAETWEKWFQSWGQSLIDDLPKASSYEVTLRLTNDAEIQHLNAQYRHKNQPTDVLAFATLDSDFPLIADEEQASEPLYLGDIVISVETAKEQAAKHNQVLGRELPWLAVHGFLHLLGWDHPDEPSLEAMLQQQETLLKKVGL